MNTFRTIDRRFEAGDTIDVGEIRSRDVEKSGNGVHFSAVEDGERSTFVILKKDMADSGEVDLPDGSIVLGITVPDSTLGVSTLWYLNPISSYGGAV